jgi:phosphoglycerol transferase MdoB-like AlkP superfamily enzyme
MVNGIEFKEIFSSIRFPLLWLVAFITVLDMVVTPTDWRFIFYGQFLLNAIFPVLFFMLLFVVSRNVRFSALFVGLSCALLYWADRELYRYWDRHIVPTQINLVTSDLKIVKLIDEIMDLPLILSAALIALPIAILAITLVVMAMTNSPKQEQRFSLRTRLTALIAVGVVASGITYGSGPTLTVMGTLDMKPRDWDAGEQIRYGLFNHFYISATRPLLFDRVVRGDPSIVVNELGYSTIKASATRNQAPDMVMMLAESMIDPLTLRADFHEDPMRKIRADGRGSRAAGLLRVHTAGGRSWLSEHSLLTGIPSSLFSVMATRPFSLADGDTRTIARPLKAQGYKTIAMYAAPTDTLFDASKTYLSLGFDEFLSVADMRERFGSADGTDDGILLNAVKGFLQKEEQPVFLFVVTHDLHMPYPPTGNARFVDKSIGTFQMQEYFRRLSVFSEKTAELVEYLETRRDPVLFGMFGDHTPPMPREFEDVGFRDGLSDPLYRTPYLIVSNYRRLDIDPSDIDVSYMPGLMLELAQLDGGTYFRINAAIRDICDGQFIQCEAPRELLDSYYTYIAVNTTVGRQTLANQITPSNRRLVRAVRSLTRAGGIGDDVGATDGALDRVLDFGRAAAPAG